MDSANERAITIVQEYRDRSSEKISRWNGYTFKQESCSRWAANEILKLLKKRQDVPPLVLIEEFADQMDHFSCLNLNTSFIFSVARDTALNIVDDLIG